MASAHQVSPPGAPALTSLRWQVSWLAAHRSLLLPSPRPVAYGEILPLTVAGTAAVLTPDGYVAPRSLLIPRPFQDRREPSLRSMRIKYRIGKHFLGTHDARLMLADLVITSSGVPLATVRKVLLARPRDLAARLQRVGWGVVYTAELVSEQVLQATLSHLHVFSMRPRWEAHTAKSPQTPNARLRRCGTGVRSSALRVPWPASWALAITCQVKRPEIS